MSSLYPDLHLIDLIKSLFKRGQVLTDLELAFPWMRNGYHPYWFSRSAWSLMAITIWRKSFAGNQTLHFWVPDYFCNQSLAGVRATGARLVFYPVTSTLTPNWDRCEDMAGDTPPHLFLLPHFFGKAGDVVGSRKFCQRHKSLLIEDCAHVILPTGAMGSSGDFVIYSQHKVFALPDGALLLARPTAMKIAGGEPEDFITSFDNVLATLPKGSPPTHTWLMKRVMHRFAPSIVKYLRKCKSSQENISLLPTDSVFHVRQSRLSRLLLAHTLPCIEAYAWCRKQNAAFLGRILGANDNMQFPELVEGPAFPYMIGVQSSYGQVDVLKHWADKAGYPVSTWPDLASEVLDSPIEHAVAIELQKQTLFFSVHHSIRGLELAGSCAKKSAAVPRDKPLVELIWDIPLKDWEALFLQAPQSQLLQSHFYAKAFQADRGWKPRFGAISLDGATLSVFVVLEKRGPFGTVVARLNRGPVWLQDHVPEEVLIAALTSILRHYSLLRGRLLFLAPNMHMSTQAMYALAATRLHRRMVRPCSSIWIDLSLREETLRSGLDSKWRNQLGVAERKGLQLDNSEDTLAFEWLLARHTELMSMRGFTGPTPKFLRHLRNTTHSAEQNFFVLRAISNGEPVAGIAVVRHGTSATYLIGYNSDEGRALNANNFLLWNAVMLLKQVGCAWFDLGGIDEYLTPGITSFKRGMQGLEYRLVGEYISRVWK